MNAFLAPAVDALAPPDAERAVRRTRNATLFVALLVLLLRWSSDPATATPSARNLLAGVFTLVALVAHLVRRNRRGPWITAGMCVASGIYVLVAGHGAAWGLVLAAILVAFLAASELRARARHIPAWRAGDYLGDATPRTVQGLAMSLVSVLIFREFAILPVHVPTGSMWPTIYGRDDKTGTKWQDHLLVDRLQYRFRAPRRWEIAVFEFPLQRDTNFVKRVIGLPGERVSIRDGDIWIDGRIARKPPLVQESLWREIFPQGAPTALRIDVANAFSAEDIRGGGWARDGGGIRGTAKGAAVSWFAYTHHAETGDLRLGAIVQPEPGATAHLRLLTHGTTVVLSLPGSAGRAGELRIGDDPPIPVERSLAGGERVELSAADGLVRATVGGVEVARGDAPATGPKRQGCAFGVSGGKVSFTAVRVERDIVYVPQPGIDEWGVPRDSYFMLGDNSQWSEDSRKWMVTEFIVKGHARPLRAPSALLVESGGPPSNIRDADGRVLFRDVDGIERSIPRADILSRNVVPAPFVPSDHLVGRALMIMWPFPPAGNEFRPRFLP